MAEEKKPYRRKLIDPTQLSPEELDKLKNHFKNILKANPPPEVRERTGDLLAKVNRSLNIIREQEAKRREKKKRKRPKGPPRRPG
jgi:hypothetical protein